MKLLDELLQFAGSKRPNTPTLTLSQTSLEYVGMNPMENSNLPNSYRAPHAPTNIETPSFLTALPVYNEYRHVNRVLDEVLKYSSDTLVVDDGSTDGTRQLLDLRDDVRVIHHEQNQGYGAALTTAFQYAIDHHYQVLITIDCDGQHEPQRIPRFVAACRDVDIVSGSRYLEHFFGDNAPPAQRKQINHQIAADLASRIGLRLTDAFCGFKAYRVAALECLKLEEDGYAMPLELWVQAVAAGLRIIELPVPLIYLDEERSFGGALDNADVRREHYRVVIERSIAAAEAAGAQFHSAGQPTVAQR